MKLGRVANIRPLDLHYTALCAIIIHTGGDAEDELIFLSCLLRKKGNLEVTMKYYTLREIARMVGVTPEAICTWEGKYIPIARREGGKRRRLWSEAQAYVILDYAASIGYKSKFYLLANYEKGGSSETAS